MVVLRKDNESNVGSDPDPSSNTLVSCGRTHTQKRELLFFPPLFFLLPPSPKDVMVFHFTGEEGDTGRKERKKERRETLQSFCLVFSFPPSPSSSEPPEEEEDFQEEVPAVSLSPGLLPSSSFSCSLGVFHQSFLGLVERLCKEKVLHRVCVEENFSFPPTPTQSREGGGGRPQQTHKRSCH